MIAQIQCAMRKAGSAMDRECVDESNRKAVVMKSK
jgi:hypothetical protein